MLLLLLLLFSFFTATMHTIIKLEYTKPKARTVKHRGGWPQTREMTKENSNDSSHEFLGVYTTILVLLVVSVPGYSILDSRLNQDG